ncbi:unnamed protein product [Sphagnum troendelagicum]|uniref:PGG domain-containing protein n=1 Tax=Sphagnum troendelagicum TaxID=128251 RepID=A0ABP0UD28_9BRYO
MAGDVATGKFRVIAAKMVVQNEHPEQASTSSGSHPLCITILNGDVATGTFRPIAAELVVQISSDTTVTEDSNRREVDTTAPVGTDSLRNAVTGGKVEAVKEILKNVNISDVNEENDKGETALELAIKSKNKEIERVLMENPQVKHYVDGLYRDRQVNVDAANAILVGAALIASITYSAWLLLPSSTDTMNATAVKAFWAFNSLSFFFAVATVVAGAYAAMPILHHEFIGRVVKRVKVKLQLASILLMLSVLCVLGAFTSGAFARLPTRISQEYKILSTAPTGLAICMVVLLFFALKLFGVSHIMSTWLKKTWVRNLLL